MALHSTELPVLPRYHPQICMNFWPWSWQPYSPHLQLVAKGDLATLFLSSINSALLKAWLLELGWIQVCMFYWQFLPVFPPQYSSCSVLHNVPEASLTFSSSFFEGATVLTVEIAGIFAMSGSQLGHNPRCAGFELEYNISAKQHNLCCLCSCVCVFFWIRALWE